ncbi:DUF2268 domain-containing putative Zn-dependent protease [Anaeromicropila herbilytica]|uniref:DUF2268 domain-containing protein n=1 Tax=Anaeromicropila herbilytica TaxID=2785025 RepID=A0A7R7EII4_9FIRM|nr:DUF2268 domain-containing putative Zn-dependent protease [Anaeromicropila herbilytica]BCN29072.1 hypothetical protein bsdtb5_03670 [Anaeromicropila herbilytica]
MNIEFIHAYLNLEDYIQEEYQNQDTWKRIMVDPFWSIISQWAPFPEEHKMPMHYLDKSEAIRQLEILKNVDWNKVMESFDMICQALPKDDEDTMYVAIYPSNTYMSEGLYGTGVWGNIILNINAINDNFEQWIPFVFAHEYHHNVWGNYWYCIRNGEGMQGNFLENIIIEGLADAFAESIFPGMNPSWHHGVRREEEEAVWDKIKSVAESCLPIEEVQKYIFGCEELGIPQNAGYYFGIKIVRAYMKKYQIEDMNELLKIPVRDIYVGGMKG